MEKIVRVGEYGIPIKSTAASLFSYKVNFKRDALKDLLNLAPSIGQIAGGKEVDKEALSSELILHRAIERGLSAADFENMTIGMIIDFLVTCQTKKLTRRVRGIAARTGARHKRMCMHFRAN